VHLSSDGGGDPPDEVHDQIFLGGSTNTANEFGLKKWEPQDFENLNESMNGNELHAILREKYS
jgi:hypothetical protein